MKKFLICLLVTGCGPISLSADANWGANGSQKFKKTIELEQSQSDAQVTSQTDIAEAIIKVIPFLTPEPTPTPVPPIPKIKSITIEMEPKTVPEIPVIVKQPYETKRPIRRLARPTPTPCP